MNTQERDEEKKFIEAFYSHLVPTYQGQATRIDGDGKCDYFLPDAAALVEIKRVRDGRETSVSARWGKTTQNLQKAIRAHQDYSDIRGIYGVETPLSLELPLKEISSVAAVIVEAVLNGSAEAAHKGMTYKITKFGSEETGIYFVGMGNAGSIDPSGVIYRNTIDLLKHANDQLKQTEEDPSFNKKVEKRIVLLVNEYRLMWRVEDMIEALSSQMQTLLGSAFIDEIWLQLPPAEDKGNPNHLLVYTRDFAKNYFSNSIQFENIEHQQLFELWYWSLEREADNQPHNFNGIKNLLGTERKPYEIFQNPHKREIMTRLGLWLLEGGRIDDAVWLIDRFIDDPDPVETAKTNESEKPDLQERIVNGQDPAIITTVMGHLAWVVKELAAKSDRHDTKNLEVAYAYTKKVLSERKNLYTILEWLTPLAEIANRRMFLLEDCPKLYKDLHDLLLDTQNGLVAKYSGYPALAKHLVLVFYYFKELTTEEAAFVLDRLQAAEQGEFLLVYLTLYRADHFKETMEIGPALKKTSLDVLSFDPTYAQEKLREVLTYSGTEPKSQELRASTVWQLWKILKDSPEEFCHLAEWVNLAFSGPYYPRLGTTLGQIMEDWYGKEVEGCANPSESWPERYLKAALEYSQDHKGQVYLGGMESTLPVLAVKQPEKLIPVMNVLTEIWMNGGYIGELSNIYSAWSAMENVQEKEKARKTVQQLYAKLRKENPKVPELKF